MQSDLHHRLISPQVDCSYSRTRLLYTNDRALEQDFKNRKLIPGPKGRIYKTPKHEHLLQENACSR